MRFKILLLLSVMFTALRSQSVIELPVWPNGAPTSNEISVDEQITANGHIEYSKEAKLYIYQAKKSKNTGKAMIICPGGGYWVLAIKHEGHDMAKWLASQGITTIVLKYRMPNHHSEVPLSDAQEAVNIVKKHAKQWNINPNQIGICGFSAGGHLASTLSTRAIDSLRPNFAILFYPVISPKEGIGHMDTRRNLLGNNNSQELDSLFASNLHVDNKTPRTLIILADDDKAVVPENSLLYYQALKKEKITASMHIFPTGGHGFGFNQSYKYHAEIKRLILDWLTNN